jgi:ABC-type phosphate transport system auxiliary subunit
MTRKKPLAERELCAAVKTRSNAVQTVAQQNDEGNTSEFEHVGSILRRLFLRKGQLEARMTAEFDPALSLQLDDLEARIQAMQEQEARPA